MTSIGFLEKSLAKIHQVSSEKPTKNLLTFFYELVIKSLKNIFSFMVGIMM